MSGDSKAGFASVHQRRNAEETKGINSWMVTPVQINEMIGAPSFTADPKTT
jgi:hypothetical protein